MPALPHYVELVARLAEMAANATNQIVNPGSVTVDGNSTATAPTSSSNLTSSPHDISTILQITEPTLISFAAYIMMQGIFLGMSIIFLFQAVELYLPRRSWLTFANVVQLLLWITRNLMIIVFNIAPSFMVDCSWRQIAVGVVSQSIILCVWWLQYIKFESMYQNRPWVCKIVLGFCFICTAATFPYIQTSIKMPDALNHCAIQLNSVSQSIYVSADVFINVLLSSLFGIAIMKHVNNTDKSWDSYAKLSYILRCDVRGSFLDTAAQLVKLFLQCATWLPGSQTLFGTHVCDFIKVLSAHWFVNDVVKNAGEHPSGNGGPSNKKTGVSKQHDAGNKGGGQAAILASCRRKGSFGSKVAQYFKGDENGPATPTGAMGSMDTLRFPVTSMDNLAIKQSGLRPSGKSTDSLRVVSISGNQTAGEATMRTVRSSDNIAMFPKRDRRQL